MDAATAAVVKAVASVVDSPDVLADGPRTSAIERLDKFVFEPDGCWRWTGTIHSTYGYGVVVAPRKGPRTYAHRAMYRMIVGPIPAERVLDHLCRNRACVNPSHLEPVTHTENVRRGVSPSVRNSQKTHCPRGHALTGESLYVDPKTGHRHCRVCRNSRSRARSRS